MINVTFQSPSLLRSALFAMGLFSLSSCANVSHMMLYQDTNLGIKGGYNPETSNISMHIGFRRNFATVVPKVRHVRASPNDGGVDSGDPDLEAASIYSASSMTLRGLHVPDVQEIVVTGDAAVALANSKGSLLPFQMKSNSTPSPTPPSR